MIKKGQESGLGINMLVIVLAPHTGLLGLSPHSTLGSDKAHLGRSQVMVQVTGSCYHAGNLAWPGHCRYLGSQPTVESSHITNQSINT